MTPSSPNAAARARRLITRVVNFVRPKPRGIPLTVDQVLNSKHASGLVEQFNDFFYASGVAGTLNWRGDMVVKAPTDLWMMIELMQRVRPRVLIETGTNFGGSASFFADMLKILEIPCTVITIDFNPKWSFEPASKNIVSLIGYSTEPDVLAKLKTELARAQGGSPGPVMVTLDSDHSRKNVLEELRLYSAFVTRDSYLIAEDTNINGHPSNPSFGPGPWEAVHEFIGENKSFVIDESCQRFLLTNNPKGWLRRVS